MTAANTSDHLVQLIYGAILEENSWTEFLLQLSLVLPGGNATLFYHDAAHRAGAFTLTSPVAEEALRDYESYYASINPWMPAASVRPLGIVVPSEAMLPTNELRRTEYYSDFLRPAEMEAAIGVTIYREQSRNFLLSVSSSVDDEGVIAAGVATVQPLVPHLKRAFDYYRRGTLSEATTSALGVSIPGNLGVCTLDPSLRITGQNEAAEALLSKGDGLWVSRSGQLCSSAPELASWTQAAMARWHMLDAHREASTFIVPRQRSKLPLRVTASPTFPYGGTEFFRGPECRLIIEDLTVAPHIDLRHVQAIFGLTRAEAVVAVGIAVGLTLEEVAHRTSTSVHTVRHHLKQIYGKMDAHRQAEVVRNVLSVAVPSRL